MWSTSSRVWEDGSLFDGGAYGDAPGSRHKKSGSGEAATAAAPDKQTLWLGVREHLHEILLDRATGWRLYLGSFVASEDRAVLSNHGIMSIVNGTATEQPLDSYRDPCLALGTDQSHPRRSESQRTQLL